MEILIRDVTPEERNRFYCIFAGESILDGKVAIEFFERVDGDLHQATQYLYPTEIEKYGEEYIRTHTKLVYNQSLEEYFAETDHAEWHNDPKRNPPMTVELEFVCEKSGENTEVWKSNNLDCAPTYYLRMLCNEPFARWMLSQGPAYRYSGDLTIRPNITFKNGDQTETVKFKDWTGCAAYSDTFNPNFRKEPEKNRMTHDIWFCRCGCIQPMDNKRFDCMAEHLATRRVVTYMLCTPKTSVYIMHKISANQNSLLAKVIQQLKN